MQLGQPAKPVGYLLTGVWRRLKALERRLQRLRVTHPRCFLLVDQIPIDRPDVD